MPCLLKTLKQFLAVLWMGITNEALYSGLFVSLIVLVLSLYISSWNPKEKLHISAMILKEFEMNVKRGHFFSVFQLQYLIMCLIRKKISFTYQN